MSGRIGARTAPRCVQCHRLATVCVCNDAQVLELRTRLCVVVHALEADKTTNTGTVAARLIAGSQVVLHGVRTSDGGVPRDQIAAEPDFTGRRPLLLFPSENAEALTPTFMEGEPISLVVPDGTWTQARRMHSRIPWMASLPHVTLPERDRQSGYKLRASPLDGRLATMEAIAAAMGILEGPEVETLMLRIFRLLVARTMAARGTPIDG
jgi:DTW domain-containing protein YfiP